MFKSSVKYQYIATFCVNILSFSYGAYVGWLSSALLVFESENSPLEGGQITSTQKSWVGSLLCVGGLVGNILFAWISDSFGRKLSLLLTVVPHTISCVLLLITKSVVHLYFSRFIGGITGGAIYAVIPVYITEISEDKVRGELGSYIVFSGNVGMFCSYVFGGYLPYYITPYILLSLPVIFLIGFYFLPETPQHLFKIKKIKEAEYSLRYFRNLRKYSREPPENFKNELQKLRHDYLEEDKSSGETSLSWNDFNSRAAKKSLCIGFVLMALNQFCGLFGMLNYTASIFEASNSSLDPNLAAIIVALIQIFGAQASTFFVERAGRKVLIGLSALCTCFGLSGLGLYSFFTSMGYDTSQFQWLPVACFSFSIFSGSLGALTLPFLVISEILPPRIRNFGSMLCMNLLWIFSFIVLKVLPILIDMLGMYGCMFIFASFSLLGGIFVIVYVPETKGRSIDAILKILEN